MEVGLIICLACYLGVVLLYLAASGRVFTRFSAAGATVELQAFEDTAPAVDELGAGQKVLIEGVEEALYDLDARLRRLEDGD